MTNRVNWTQLLVFSFSAFVCGCLAGILVVNRHNPESVLAADAALSNAPVANDARQGTDVEIRDSMEVVSAPVTASPAPARDRTPPPRAPAAKPEMIYVAPLQAPIAASPADVTATNVEESVPAPASPPRMDAVPTSVESPPAAPPVAAARERAAPLMPPQRIRRVAPDYPRFARINNIEGTVIIAATIDTEGKVTYPRIVRSVKLLDDAALNAVQQWEFTPGTRGGQPVPVDVTLSVEFSLLR